VKSSAFSVRFRRKHEREKNRKVLVLFTEITVRSTAVYEFRYKLQSTTKLERISTRMKVLEKKFIGVNFVLFSVRRKIFVDRCKR
jgi:glutamate racemase